MTNQSPQSSNNNLFPSFDLNSLLIYSALVKAFSAVVSTPFENFRSQAQTNPKNYQGMFYTAKRLGITESFKGVSLNISLGIIKQCGYRNYFMVLATQYNLSATQAAFLLTLGDSAVAQPLIRLKTHYTTSKNISLYEIALKEKNPIKFFTSMSKGFSTKFTNDLLAWSVFYSFDPFIRRYARNNSSTDVGYYGIIFGGYAIAGSVTEIALAPLKFCLTHVQKYEQPVKAASPASLLKWAIKNHGRQVFAGSVPSICSAASKLFTTSLIQERINQKYKPTKER